MGFFPFGDGGPAAERSETTIGGRIPFNPSGGLESKGHPIGATGLGQICELVTQLRDESGPRQVEGARIGLQENGGGLIGIEEAAGCLCHLGEDVVNLAVLLRNSALSFSDRPAVSVSTSTVHNYGILGSRVARLAGSLSYPLRLALGARVALAMKNCPEYIEILFSCWHAGLAVVRMNVKLHANELAFMIEDCGAGLVFASQELAGELAALLPRIRMIVPGSAEYKRLLENDPIAIRQTGPDDLAWISYTSGMTGQPKGAMPSHRNLLAMIASGLFALSFVAKAGNNILPEAGGYNPSEVTAIVAATPTPSFFAAPTLLRRMTSDPLVGAAKIDNIRTVLLGSAPIYAEDIRAGFGSVRT